SLVVAGGTVYAGGGNEIHALDAGTGQRQWKYQIGGVVYGGPVSGDGLVYAGGADGKGYAIHADGTLAWSTATVGQPTHLTPVADSRLYAATQGANGSSDRIGEAYAIDAGTGKVVWNAHVSILAEAVTVADGIAYVSSFDKRFYAIRVGSNTPLWTVTTTAFVP